MPPPLMRPTDAKLLTPPNQCTLQCLFSMHLGFALVPQLLKTLSRHFVELNAPDGLDPANEVAAAAWTQEVFALAYSLQVVARWVPLGP